METYCRYIQWIVAVPFMPRSPRWKAYYFRAPASAGSYYYNYKDTNSIVLLLGLVDARYCFTYVNIGMNGRISDDGVFRNSKLSEAIYNNVLNFPEPELLPGLTEKLPYVVVADDAFPLSKHLLKPYS